MNGEERFKEGDKVWYGEANEDSARWEVLAAHCDEVWILHPVGGFTRVEEDRYLEPYPSPFDER